MALDVPVYVYVYREILNKRESNKTKQLKSGQLKAEQHTSKLFEAKKKKKTILALA